MSMGQSIWGDFKTLRFRVVRRWWWACVRPAARTAGTASLWRCLWMCRCATYSLRWKRRSALPRNLDRCPSGVALDWLAAGSQGWCRRKTAVCFATATSTRTGGSWESGLGVWSRRWSDRCASSHCWQCQLPSSGARWSIPPSPARQASCRSAGGCRAGLTQSGPPGPLGSHLRAAAMGGWLMGQGLRQLQCEKDRHLRNLSNLVLFFML